MRKRCGGCWCRSEVHRFICMPHVPASGEHQVVRCCTHGDAGRCAAVCMATTSSLHASCWQAASGKAAAAAHLLCAHVCRRPHAHVQRAVLHEAEAALRLVQLRAEAGSSGLARSWVESHSAHSQHAGAKASPGSLRWHAALGAHWLMPGLLWCHCAEAGKLACTARQHWHRHSVPVAQCSQQPCPG
jgi:hypothetical protein